MGCSSENLNGCDWFHGACHMVLYAHNFAIGQGIGLSIGRPVGDLVTHAQCTWDKPLGRLQK